MLGVLIESADIIRFMDNGKLYIASRAKNPVKLPVDPGCFCQKLGLV